MYSTKHKTIIQKNGPDHLGLCGKDRLGLRTLTAETMRTNVAMKAFLEQVQT